MAGKIIAAVGLAGIGLLLFGKGLELVIEYWLPLAIVFATSTVIWFVIRLRNDYRGGYTNKSPERFSKDYREVRKGREGQ